MDANCISKNEPARAKRILAPGIILLLALTLAGCSTNTLTSGVNLAKVGQTAAIQMQQNATLSANSLTALRKAVAFNDGYNQQPGNTNSPVFLDNMTAIQGELAQYGKLLGSLSQSYSALGDLAGYDAAGNFNSAIGSLATDTATFASAIGKPITIPPQATAGVKVVGGLVIGSIQAGNVKNASKQIETILTNVIAILDEPRTKQILIENQRQVVGQIDQAAVVLIGGGIFSYSALLDDLGSPLGLKSNAKSDDAVKGDAKIQAGLRNVAIELANEQISAQAAAYDQSLAALKALVPLHENIQKGEPLNLETVINIIQQLQTIAAMFQPIK